MSYASELFNIKLTALCGQTRDVDVDDFTFMWVVFDLLVDVVCVPTVDVGAQEALLLFHVGFGRRRDGSFLFGHVFIEIVATVSHSKSMLIQIRFQLRLGNRFAHTWLEILINLAWAIR